MAQLTAPTTRIWHIHQKDCRYTVAGPNLTYTIDVKPRTNAARPFMVLTQANVALASVRRPINSTSFEIDRESGSQDKQDTTALKFPVPGVGLGVWKAHPDGRTAVDVQWRKKGKTYSLLEVEPSDGQEGKLLAEYHANKGWFSSGGALHIHVDCGADFDCMTILTYICMTDTKSTVATNSGGSGYSGIGGGSSATYNR